MYIHLKRIFIFLAVIAGIIFIAMMMSIGDSERSEMKASWNIAHPGDSLYLEDFFFKQSDSGFTQRATFRAIRPLNKADIDKMQIADWQKTKLIAELDTSAENNRTVMIRYKLNFIKDEMYKKHTSFIGTYVKSDSVLGDYQETIYIPKKWHVIKPNLEVADSNFVFSMPEHYVFADSNYYVDHQGVRIQEPAIFRKKK